MDPNQNDSEPKPNEFTFFHNNMLEESNIKVDLKSHSSLIVSNNQW